MILFGRLRNTTSASPSEISFPCAYRGCAHRRTVDARAASLMRRLQLIPGCSTDTMVVIRMVLHGRFTTAWVAPLVLMGLLGIFQQVVIATAASAATPPDTYAERQRKRADVLKHKHGLTDDYDQGPQPAKITHPHYPKAAFKECIEGTVSILIVIDVNGRVSDAEVVESIPALDEEALATVRKWRFKPARKAGVPVPSLAGAPVTFRLDASAKRHAGCARVLLPPEPGCRRTRALKLTGPLL
jgi:TonB family protein